MSDTPRTDAAQHEGLLRGNPIPTSVTTAEFARQLERELAATKANAIDEAVRRMEEVPVLELNKLHYDAMDYGNFNDIEAIRARLISAAKGEA
jgi:hypothetical protein